MIEAIIALINSRFVTLDLFKDVRGLCEIIQSKEGDSLKSFPAEYCDGEYKHIDFKSNWEDGISYHRQIGVNTEEDGEEGVTACDVEVIRTYPMRVVCLIPKDKFTNKNNNQFIDDKFATNIANSLKIVNSSVIAQTLKAETVSVDIVATQKDRYTVFEEEFTLPDGHVPKFEFAFFFVDYIITIAATQKCFENFDCDGFVVPEFCPVFVPVVITDINNPDSPVSRNSGTTYTCELGSGCTLEGAVPFIDQFSCVQLNENLTQAQRDFIQHREAAVSGLTTSGRANDDGDLETGIGFTAPGVTDAKFFVLGCNNTFGQIRRFSDDVGDFYEDTTGNGVPNAKNVATAYDNLYLIDHLTGMGWTLEALGNASWNDAVDGASTYVHSILGFSDWRLPTPLEILGLFNYELNTVLNWQPFGVAGVNSYWTGTEVRNDIARALVGRTEGTRNNGSLTAGVKVNAFQQIYIRNNF